MKNSKHQTLNRFCAKHGLILGAVYVTISLLHWLLYGKINDPKTYEGTIIAILLILGLLIFTRQYRNANHKEHFTFSQAFATTFRTSIYTTLIVTLYHYIYFKVTPEAVENMLIAIQNTYQATGSYSDNDIASIVSVMKKIISPEILAITSFLGIAIEMTIYSLITSLFLKHTPQNTTNSTTPFDRDMSEIK